MKMLFRYLRPYYGVMALGLTIKIIGTLVELVLPYVLSHILDHVVPMGEVRLIVAWGGVMILCAAMALVFNVIANRMASRVAKGGARGIRHDLFAATMRLSGRQTDAFTIPSLEARLTSDTYNLHHYIGMMQRLGVRAPILLIGGIAITLSLDMHLTLVMICVLPFIALSVFLISARGVPLYGRVQGAVDNMVRVVREDAQGIRVILALSKVDYERKRYDHVNRELVKTEKRAAITMAATNPLINLFLNAGLVAVIVVGAFRVNGDLSEPGRIIAFIQYFTLLSNAMLSITRIFVITSKATASAKRIDEVMKTPIEPQIYSKQSYPDRDTNAHIVFDHVNFSYTGRTNDLTDINFSLPHGATLGIIGATGSGKSTLLSLLMRFYDVDSGAIYIDGQDTRTMEKGEINATLGVAMQNDFITNDTIAENIRFGRDISMEQVKRAARISQAAPFIEALEDGYEHMLTAKGTNLSGGQRQRLLIARAIAGEPSLLLLDDSSSALDYQTDANLRTAIREELTGTTTVVVAQRVSSVQHADLILVLEGGCIIGAGRHEELLATCDVYREISESQMGGALLE
ncbi:MAG: ABC transporter ATP-binding protein [Clostridia bacterium]|nr:ABC transporter ATP-binding protein [Clostridia bacterium]